MWIQNTIRFKQNAKIIIMVFILTEEFKKRKKEETLNNWTKLLPTMCLWNLSTSLIFLFLCTFPNTEKKKRKRVQRSSPQDLEPLKCDRTAVALRGKTLERGHPAWPRVHHLLAHGGWHRPPAAWTLTPAFSLLSQGGGKTRTGAIRNWSFQMFWF